MAADLKVQHLFTAELVRVAGTQSEKVILPQHRKLLPAKHRIAEGTPTLKA